MAHCCDKCGKEIPTGCSTYLIELRRKSNQYQTSNNKKIHIGGLEICEDCKNQMIEFLHINFYDPKSFKRKRNLLGLSQQQLAKETNLSQATISAVENGFATNSPVTITHIGKYLNAIAEKKGMLEEFYKLENEDVE